MKIVPSQLSQISSTYQKQAQKSNNDDEQDQSKDVQIDISDKAREIQTLQNKLDKTDEIREDKVQEIKDQLNSGTYQVRPEQLAQKLLNGQE